ncbi:mCG148043 [Mus musculus]|jgi:hypothetical protein|nr:mCG148043 [Mus musculus]
MLNESILSILLLLICEGLTSLSFLMLVVWFFKTGLLCVALAGLELKDLLGRSWEVEKHKTGSQSVTRIRLNVPALTLVPVLLRCAVSQLGVFWWIGLLGCKLFLN